MSWAETTLLVVAAAIVVLALSWVRASRLDRLHRKVAASRIALDAQLVRRASAATDLATSGLLDPASSVLVADAAYAVFDAEGAAVTPEDALDMAGLGGDRERLESALSATLREALDGPQEVGELRGTLAGEALVANLAATWYRAQLARRFHNEAVAQAQRARRHGWVRALRLAGRAPVPHTVELDDLMPAGLGAPGPGGAAQTER